MNNFFTNLLKALGVLALSALIFFLFVPKEEIKDQAVNLALEFLGKRLLAMAPQEHQREVETRFETVRERVERGEIDNEQLENFTAFVVNANEPLNIAEIDSTFAALSESEAATQVEEKRIVHQERRLEEWAQRMHEFEQFEKRWQTLVPDSLPPSSGLPRHRRPRFYRLSKKFVVQIDSAALAHAVGIAQVVRADSLPQAAFAGHFPPPPHFNVIMRQLENDLGGLRVELRSNEFQRQWQWADSVRARARHMAREQRGVIVTVPPQTPTPPTPETQPPPRKN